MLRSRDWQRSVTLFQASRHQVYIESFGMSRESRSLQLRILFVCTGNICRSPLAERLIVAFGAQFGIADFTASSAGTRAVVAHPIHIEAARIIARLGGDPSKFGARQMTPKIVADADLILTMTRDHRDVVLRSAPRHLHKTFTLSEAARLVEEFNAQSVADLAAFRSQLALEEAADVVDPIGRRREIFEMVGMQIVDLLAPILVLCQRSSVAIAD